MIDAEADKRAAEVSWKLTHWGQDKMAAISQTTFSNAFSWMIMYEFSLWFSLKFFPRGPIDNTGILGLIFQKKKKKIIIKILWQLIFFQVRARNNFTKVRFCDGILWSNQQCQKFQIFAGPLFQVKPYLLSTVLLSGFQSSTWAVKSTE